MKVVVKRRKGRAEEAEKLCTQHAMVARVAPVRKCQMSDYDNSDVNKG